MAVLLVLVGASVAIHGYHYGIEDEAIYLPAIKAHLNPALYPHDAVFFQLQTRATLFDDLVAVTVRVLHAPVVWTVFGYYLATLLAFYGGLWALAARLFRRTRGRLGGVLLVSALLTLPVAGTCIFIVDQHLHPRTLATALILWAAARLAPRAEGQQTGTLDRVGAWDYGAAALLMVGATLIHVQMAFYGVLFLCVLALPAKAMVGRLWGALIVLACVAPVLLATLMEKGGPEWQEAARTRTQHYLMQWEWYEWLGAIAPIFLLWGMARFAHRQGLPVASAVALRTALFAAMGFAAGCVITIPPRMERLTAFQPLRTLHLTYIVMLLVAGGMAAEFALKEKLWRWTVLLLPIAAGMSYAQFQSFPDSRHVELPSVKWSGQEMPRQAGNDWVEAFDWVKANTPVDAYFALDPRYMSSEGEDYHGFRGLAERGQMADWDKDPGVAMLFPELAVRWSREVHALDNWKNFTVGDFHRLHEQFGVGYTVLPVSATGGGPSAFVTIADCEYRNRSVAVCKIR